MINTITFISSSLKFSKIIFSYFGFCNSQPQSLNLYMIYDTKTKTLLPSTYIC